MLNRIARQGARIKVSFYLSGWQREKMMTFRIGCPKSDKHRNEIVDVAGNAHCEYWRPS